MKKVLLGLLLSGLGLMAFGCEWQKSLSKKEASPVYQNTSEKKSFSPASPSKKALAQAQWKNKTFYLEVARTQKAREKGLMYRKHLPKNQGMLFIFPEAGYHAFWMKNTLLPLDIIWLNEKGAVVYALTAPPCKRDPCPIYTPPQKALYVIELPAHTFTGSIGDTFTLQIPPRESTR